MKMEIKVDVHAVHPAASKKPEVKTTGTNEPYGSWCTPQETPSHVALAKTNSNTDSKITLEKFKNSETFQLQKVRLFSSTPPGNYRSSTDVSESITELKDFKKTISRQCSDEPSQGEKPIPPRVIPQSSVPSKPSQREKWKGYFTLPTFCDPSVPIDPHGRGYISWLFLVTFCYSYNAWCIALRATFTLYQTPENTHLWMAADYFCDMIYILDVALVKPRLMYLHEGFWVNDTKETRKYYRKKLQYLFDVISLLPLDILYVFYGTKMVILRFPRLLKLQTFWEFHRAVDRVLSSPYIVRIGKTLFYIFYLIHLNACAYYAMSKYIGLGTNGWVYDEKGNAYIRCFYFATKTATSIGKNPKPEQTIEYLFMTGAWLMGVFVFALLIGQIRDIYTTATRARTEYRKRVDGCIQYLRRLNMPMSLQRRVTSWFNYTWKEQRCFDESNILNSLPFNMKRDVALTVHMSTLSKVQLFSNCSESLLRDLVLQLRSESFLPGDIVVRRGEIGHHMYIIKSGKCCVMSPDEKEVMATLHEGSVFGEISLLGIDGLRHRTATVSSRGFSNLFALSRNDLEAALKQHKEAAQILRRRADQIIRENAARQATRRLDDRQARKSASIQEDSASAAAGAKDRRLSSASSNVSWATEGKRHRSASALSRKRLAAVLENKAQSQECEISLASVPSGRRTPLPAIVLTAE